PTPRSSRHPPSSPAARYRPPSPTRRSADRGAVVAALFFGQQGDKGAFQIIAARAAQQFGGAAGGQHAAFVHGYQPVETLGFIHVDRKSTRLNSSHVTSSYAVFGLKAKSRAD